MGSSALSRLPQTRLEASHSTIKAAPGALIIERRPLTGLAVLRLRVAVQDTDCGLSVIPRRRNELIRRLPLVVAAALALPDLASSMRMACVIFVFRPKGEGIMAA